MQLFAFSSGRSLQATRNRGRTATLAEKFTAPAGHIQAGHRAATLVHVANVATRLSRVLRFDPITDQITGDPEANALTRRSYRDDHWAAPKTA